MTACGHCGTSLLDPLHNPECGTEICYRPPSRAVRADEYEPPQLRWLVEHMVPAGVRTVLLGREGHGKSWMHSEIVASVLTGTPLMGKAVPAGPATVLVVDSDGPPNGDLYRRIRAAIRGRQVDAETEHRALERLTLLDHKVDNIHSPRGMQEVIDAAKTCGGALVTLDSIQSLTGNGFDENRTPDAMAFHDQLARLHTEHPCTTLTLHNSGKQAISESRGNTGLLARFDAAWRMNRPAWDKARFVCFPVGRRIAPTPPFRIRHEIENDPNGSPVRSLFHHDGEIVDHRERELAELVEWVLYASGLGIFATEKLYGHIRASFSTTKINELFNEAVESGGIMKARGPRNLGLYHAPSAAPHTLRRLDPETKLPEEKALLRLLKGQVSDDAQFYGA